MFSLAVLKSYMVSTGFAKAIGPDLWTRTTKIKPVHT